MIKPHQQNIDGDLKVTMMIIRNTFPDYHWDIPKQYISYGEYGGSVYTNSSGEGLYHVNCYNQGSAGAAFYYTGSRLSYRLAALKSKIVTITGQVVTKRWLSAPENQYTRLYWKRVSD